MSTAFNIMWNGIKNTVSSIYNTIESWMPDFMSGLAKGIEKSKGMVKDALSGLAADMVVSPQINAGQMAAAGGGSVSSADLNSLVSAIREGVSGMNGNSGDIVIPVYLGGTMLDREQI